MCFFNIFCVDLLNTLVYINIDDKGKGYLLMEIHERIKTLRKNILKMSQTAFGEHLGVNRDVINNIENNRLARPEQKLSLYKLICSEFNISEDWLLNGVGDMYASKDTEYGALIDRIMAGENEIAKNIFKAFALFDEEDWAALQHMIEKYLEAAKKEETATSETEDQPLSYYDAVPKTPEELEALYLRPAVKKNGTDEK